MNKQPNKAFSRLAIAAFAVPPPLVERFLQFPMGLAVDSQRFFGVVDEPGKALAITAIPLEARFRTWPP